MNNNISKNLYMDYIRIANYYYKDNLTQEEIAKKMNISRQKVNRILNKCIELGIVQINIANFEDSHLWLEVELEKKYKLKSVRVIDCDVNEDIYVKLGKCAAEYLSNIINDGDIIGLSRGRSISALVDNMPDIKKKKIIITQLMGGWNNEETNIGNDDIVRRFSEKINAKSNMLYAPIVVNNPELRKAIMNEPFFLEAYNIIKSCTIAIVGIGDVKNQQILPSIKDDDYKYLIDKNVVGEICTHFFDINGLTVKTPLDNRVIAIELNDFLRIPIRIGVAGAKSKIFAILGALKGGYINTLITDYETAKLLNE